jgi:hypothetical protein
MNWLIEGLILIALGVLVACIAAKTCEYFGDNR